MKQTIDKKVKSRFPHIRCVFRNVEGISDN